jgi:methylthioribose-1-phosphate isomerase
MNIETHCNAGWLAFVDYGTALSPVYIAYGQGKKIFVYVDETRPRNQGARLTAWELKQAGVPHTIIPDNAGAWLMSLGKIDMMIVGADRIAANGDTANKIGTYSLAVLAKAHRIPFYVAAPLSTIDIGIRSGTNIPIEERRKEEVIYFRDEMIARPETAAFNPAFDVTPHRLISAIITEKGILRPDFKESIGKLKIGKKKHTRR